MNTRILITVRLESFEGPLDLLLYLIQTHELSISKISITQITDQYLAYIRLMQELNFEFASEFLVMAATLLLWKSKSLLPQEEKANAADGSEEGALTQEELIRQLLEHQRFLAAGENLAQLPRLDEDVFARPNRKPPIERIWRDLELSDLALAYQTSMIRARKRTQILKKETVSLSDKILEFSERLTLNHLIELRSLLPTLATRGDIVATFLASLELARLKKMKIYQEGVYSSIYLELIQALTGFDLSLASGFDSEEKPKDKEDATEAVNTEPMKTEEAKQEDAHVG